MIKKEKFEMTRSEVDAVIDYIFTHVRASPNGKGYKVWERMLAFQNRQPEKSQPAGGALTARTGCDSL